MARKNNIEEANSFGEDVLASLKDFAERVAKEETITVRTVRLDLEPAKFTARDVKRLRKSLGVSQAVFAKLLAVSAKLVQHWERGERQPSPLARRLMDEVRDDPNRWIGKIMRDRTSRVPA